MNTNRLFYCVFFLCFLSVLTSCNSDDESPMEEEMEEEMDPNMEEPDGDTFTVNSIQGLSQKGPYLIGSTITILELENDLSPTGRSFTENITNNLGSFEISNLTLASSFVELRASGFYFNEITGENSQAQLNLSALVDLTNQSSINVNLLTTLEKNRVEHLIEQGSSFSEAKTQALTEVLNIFEISDSANANAEQLNIAEDGNGNAILLAVSAILQGNNSVGDVSELISKISLGIETDGILDDDMVCSQLSSSASLINPSNIRENLEEWYTSANTSISIPEFEPFVTQYIQNTPCLAESGITFPQSGNSGLNLLNQDNTDFTINESYSMRAVLDNGTSLRVKVIGNNWSRNVGQGDTGWLIGEWEGERSDIDRGFIFNSARTGSIDFKINLTLPFSDGPHFDEIIFELFENGSSVPTRTIVKKIQGITPRPSSPIDLLLATPSTTGPTENILGRIFGLGGSPQVTKLDEDNKYGFGVFLPNNFEIEILLSGENFDFPSSGFNQGWTIEQLDMNENQWRLSASGIGFYETEMALDFSQGCVTLNTEIIVNGESIRSFSANSSDEFVFFFPQLSGQYGPNILFSGNVLSAGEASLAAEIDLPNSGGLDDLTVVLHGEGWTIPTPIENKNWIIENYDSVSQSQTFRGTFDNTYYDGENDLRLMIDNFNASNPPDIFVEIISEVEGCGDVVIDSFNLRF